MQQPQRKAQARRLLLMVNRQPLPLLLRERRMSVPSMILVTPCHLWRTLLLLR